MCFFICVIPQTSKTSDLRTSSTASHCFSERMPAEIPGLVPVKASGCTAAAGKSRKKPYIHGFIAMTLWSMHRTMGNDHRNSELSHMVNCSIVFCMFTRGSVKIHPNDHWMRSHFHSHSKTMTNFAGKEKKGWHILAERDPHCGHGITWTSRATWRSSLSSF